MSTDYWWIVPCLAIILGAILIAAASFFLVRRIVPFEVLKKHHDLAGFIIGTLGTLYSVFLGFTIVNSRDRLEQITSRVNKEAYLLGNLSTITDILPADIQKPMQQSIKAYLYSIIEDEWPLMKDKKENPETLEKFRQMWKTYTNFKVQTPMDEIWFADVLNILLDLNSARLERIYTSWETLGVLSWAALILGAVALFILLFLFGTENVTAHLLMNSLFISVVTFMIFVVYSLDNPFRPPNPIQPTAYKIIYTYHFQESGNKIISPEDIRFD